MYDEEQVAKAWQTFIATGEILEGAVRPEIARSWKRSKEAGVDPWSTDSPRQNVALLREKRAKFKRSLQATSPLMRFLAALFGCNVSLMDHENFVFELVTPYIDYPLTLGTFVLEETVGTGNATIIAYEKKPIRVNRFEQYRKVSQSYTGVSAPFLDDRGKYHGAMNINDPFGRLPESALDLCVTAVDMSGDLFRAGQKQGALTLSPDYFRPLLMMFDQPAMIVTAEGKVSVANAGMAKLCPALGRSALGSKRLVDVLARPEKENLILSDEDIGDSTDIIFRHGAGEKKTVMKRRSFVCVDGCPGFFLCVFEPENNNQHVAKDAHRRKPVSPAFRGIDENDSVDYIGESEEWKEIDATVQQVARLNVSVLILGETGTGKEVVARALHRRSGRTGEFVAINCGALPRELLAAELFGYESGAFTGAREAGAMGKFEYADGGTLFLDEIGEMPLDMQVSLLRVLQEKCVTRLGSNEPKSVDVRIIAATNQDIERLIEEKKFRSDLYYRIGLVELQLPPLRRRASDVPLLVEYFNKVLSDSLGLSVTPFSQDVIDVLVEYSWPGNVRELRNVIERYLVMAGGGSFVTLDMLPPSIANACVGGSFRLAKSTEMPLGRPIRDDGLEKEKSNIVAAVESCGGNLSLAAKSLGISRNTLSRRMEKLRLRIRVIVEDMS